MRPVHSAVGRSFIEPGSPWQNPFVESFGFRVRDEVLSVEALDSVLEAQTVITDWRKRCSLWPERCRQSEGTSESPLGAKLREGAHHTANKFIRASGHLGQLQLQDSLHRQGAEP